MSATVLGIPVAKVLELESQGFRSNEVRRRAVVDLLGRHVSLTRYLQALLHCLEQNEQEMREIDPITTRRLLAQFEKKSPLRERMEAGK